MTDETEPGKNLPPDITAGASRHETVAAEEASSVPWDTDALPDAPAAELIPESAFPVIAEVLSFLAEIAEIPQEQDDSPN